MVPHKIRRSFEILHDQGPLEFIEKSETFLLEQLLSEEYLFKYQTFKNYLSNRVKYDIPPDPYKIIYIKPRNVRSHIYYLRLSSENHHYYKYDDFPLKDERKSGIGKIIGGDWDSNKYQKDIFDVVKIKGLRERFVEGIDWEDTTYYEYYRKRCCDTNRHEQAGFNTVEEYMWDRCHYIEDLYHSIENEGYKSGHTGPGSHGRTGIREQLEILVTIGRNGEIYLWDGKHRFTIARILDLEIPVQVVCRHKQWQEIREDIHNNGLSEADEELRDHPDLQDILH